MAILTLQQRSCAALRHRYTTSQLVEVNAHSLFSKWFSESGKLVSKLFAAITELVEEPQALVFVLIDEVESLSAARKVRRLGWKCSLCCCPGSQARGGWRRRACHGVGE
jgi:SpoVK/Ycf46/Vps4 family AAA+-type ATPase